ncbi:MAG TPA: hypothetical protein VGH08_11060 [Chthoniobacterales bacterium]|jgi:hypothetical protein
MPLQLNLLHEEVAQERQRKRDPLKISMYVGAGVAALLALNYLWSAYRTLSIKAHLSTVERNWAKVEPQVTAAQKRAEELNGIIGTTKTLDQIIDGRFYWAPMLEKISRCVTPNLQITNLDGMVDEESKAISISLEGTAAGREPRSVAEDFRQMLLEQVGKERPVVKVEFKALEDLDTLVNVGGSNVPAAHFIVSVSLSNGSKTPPPGPADRKSKPTKEES